MIRVSSGKLVTINVGFKSAFKDGFASALADSSWNRIATLVPSEDREEEYGWLKDIPMIREWFGDRVINQLADEGYKIRNRKFELTVGVKGDDINDDRVGIYGPRFKFMGDEAARFPNRLVYDLLKSGFTAKCYDGQPFFDANHPYIKADGTTATQSNYQAGAGTPWFLLCTKRPLKPLIFQEREKFDYVELTKPTDPNVFMRDELLYGVDGRANTGFGFWQMALGSKATLDATNFKALRQMGERLLGDHGKALGLTFDLFVGEPAHRDAADELFNTATLAAGGGNPLFKAVDTLITPYLI